MSFSLSNNVFLLGIQKQTCAYMLDLKGQPPEEFHKYFSPEKNLQLPF